MKAKIINTNQIIDVKLSHSRTNGNNQEYVYVDTFTGKYYNASELEEIVNDSNNWIKLTNKTFNELLTAYRSGKGVAIAKAHTQFAGAIYYSYHIYHGNSDIIETMIKEGKYFYIILDEPNFKQYEIQSRR